MKRYLSDVVAKIEKPKDTVKREVKIDEVELFGEKNKQPEGLEVITRLPLKPRDQIQSISTISYKVIEGLGGLTVTDVAKNIPGKSRANPIIKRSGLLFLFIHLIITKSPA